MTKLHLSFLMDTSSSPSWWSRIPRPKLLVILVAFAACISYSCFYQKRNRLLSEWPNDDNVVNCCEKTSKWDCWDYLNVSHAATDLRIRKARRKQARLLHPDKNSLTDNTVAHIRTAQLNTAFDLISTDIRRRKCIAMRQGKTVTINSDPAIVEEQEEYEEALRLREIKTSELHELPHPLCSTKNLEVYIPVIPEIGHGAHHYGEWVYFEVPVASTDICPQCKGSGDARHLWFDPRYNMARAHLHAVPLLDGTPCPLCYGWGCPISDTVSELVNHTGSLNNATSHFPSFCLFKDDERCSHVRSSLSKISLNSKDELNKNYRLHQNDKLGFARSHSLACNDIRTPRCMLCHGSGSVGWDFQDFLSHPRCKACWGSGLIRKFTIYKFFVKLGNTTGSTYCNASTCWANMISGSDKLEELDPCAEENYSGIVTLDDSCSSLHSKFARTIQRESAPRISASLFSTTFTIHAPYQGDMTHECDYSNITFKVQLFHSSSNAIYVSPTTSKFIEERQSRADSNLEETDESLNIIRKREGKGFEHSLGFKASGFSDSLDLSDEQLSRIITFLFYSILSTLKAQVPYYRWCLHNHLLSKVFRSLGWVFAATIRFVTSEEPRLPSIEISEDAVCVIVWNFLLFPHPLIPWKVVEFMWAIRREWDLWGQIWVNYWLSALITGKFKIMIYSTVALTAMCIYVSRTQLIQYISHKFSSKYSSQTLQLYPLKVHCIMQPHFRMTDSPQYDPKFVILGHFIKLGNKAQGIKLERKSVILGEQNVDNNDFLQQGEGAGALMLNIIIQFGLRYRLGYFLMDDMQEYEDAAHSLVLEKAGACAAEELWSHVLYSPETMIDDAAEAFLDLADTGKNAERFQKILSKVERIGSHISENMQTLSTPRQLLSSHEHKPWIVIFELLQTIVCNKEHITNLFSESNSISETDYLNGSDWDTISLYYKFLVRFHEAKSPFNNEATIEQVPGILRGLNQHCTEFVQKVSLEDDSRIKHDICTRISKAVCSLDSWYKYVTNHHSIYLAALILHPSYGLAYIHTVFSPGKAQAGINSLQHLFRRAAQEYAFNTLPMTPSLDTASTTTTTTKVSKGPSTSKQLCKPDENNTEPDLNSTHSSNHDVYGNERLRLDPYHESEITHFMTFSEHQFPSTDNGDTLEPALEWWMKDLQCRNFPILSSVAMNIFSIPVFVRTKD